MEVWKVIVLFITAIWSIRIVMYGFNRYECWRISDIEGFFYAIILIVSLVILGESVNWDFLFDKI